VPDVSPAVSAILLDAAGVMIFPQPGFMLAQLQTAGLSPDPAVLDQAHFRAMAVQDMAGRASRAGGWWPGYLEAYFAACGVPEAGLPALAEQAAAATTRGVWTYVRPGTKEGLRSLAALGVPMGVVSNADGRLQAQLARLGLCYVPGDPETGAETGPAGPATGPAGPATGPAAPPAAAPLAAAPPSCARSALSACAWNGSPQSSSRRASKISAETPSAVRSTADFVSLHLPLLREGDSPTPTHHLINETTLRMMRPTAMIINTARGLVVDENALAKALRENWIAGAALDVYENEPLPADSPLRDPAIADRCRLFPHFASAARITRLSADPDKGMAGRCVQGLIDVLEGNYGGDVTKMPYVVNKEGFV